MKIKNYPKNWRHFILNWIKNENRLFCQMCGHDITGEYEEKHYHHIICSRCRMLFIEHKFTEERLKEGK